MAKGVVKSWLLIGSRVAYATMTFKNPDLDLLNRVTKIWIRELYPLKLMKRGYLSIAIMFLTTDEIAHMSKNGGNPLGLQPEDGDLMRMSLSNITN